MGEGNRGEGVGTADRRWMGDFAKGAAAEGEAEEAADKILEAHIVVGVVTNGKFLAGGVDGAGGVEAGGVDAQVDVGHEGAEHDEAIAALDVLADVVAAHGALVNAEVKGMLLA